MIEDMRIERLGRRGDGVARTENGVAHVAGALPGERVRGALIAGRMDAPEIVEASPDRIEPVCPHYGDCGGCRLQHGSDAMIAGFKRALVADALAAEGLDAAPVEPVRTVPAASRRRAVFSGMRTKKTVRIGFHARADDRVVEIGTCAVAAPGLMAALPALRELTRLGASRKGEAKFAVTLGPAGLDVAASDVKPADGPLRAALAGVAVSHDLARLAWEGETLAMRRPPAIPMGRAKVIPPPGGFLQAAAEGEAALLDVLRPALAGAKRIVDLFAGCGTFSLPLAESAEVHAVEGDPALLDALAAGWRAAPGLKGVSVEVRDLFRRPLFRSEIDGFDAVVIDPPRAGAEAQMAEIAASRITRVAALSCDAVTFARDAAVLARGGFRLDRVVPVDQFRWSAHVEIAALFSR